MKNWPNHFTEHGPMGHFSNPGRPGLLSPAARELVCYVLRAKGAMMRRTIRLSFGLFCSMTASEAFAGAPSDVVRPFYLQPGLELEASARGNFIDPARKVLNQNDEIRQGGEEGCLDPALPFNDTDFDPAEIERTLKLEEVVSGSEATVLAKFMSEGQEQAVQWRLKDIGGRWRIFDMVSMSKDWALSRFQCE